jgi:cytochrome P450
MRAVRLLLDPLGTFEQLRRRHGPVVRVPVGRGGFHLVCDPAAIQDVLVTSHHDYAKGFRRRSTPPGEGVQPISMLVGEGLLTSSGEAHRTRRRLMTPLFHRQRIAAYGSTFAQLAEQRCAGWPDGGRIDAHSEMSELTLAIVARTVFDTDIDSDVVATIRRAVAANARISRLAVFPNATTLERRLPLPAIRRARRARAELFAAVQGMVDDRRRAGLGGWDLMSLLSTARDADTGAFLDDEAVRDESLTILLAGHETTANALSWAFHLLGGCERARAAMHAELDAVLGGRLPTIEDLPNLPYTRAVFTETLRLYPPAWLMVRRSLRARTLGGVHVPADTTLLLSQWVVHRDPEIWPEPAAFRPERWLGDDPAAGRRHRFGFFPFGGGIRQCIGNTFAETEGAMILATVGRRWTLEPVAGHRVEPLPRVTLRPKGGLPMTARRR